MGSAAEQSALFAVIGAAVLAFLRRRRLSLAYLSPASKSGKVVALFYYPVKGCKAVEIKDTAELTSTGIKHDRKWLIVDKSNVFMTQRRLRQLALLEANVIESSGGVDLNLRVGEKSIRVPLCDDEAMQLKEPVVIWEREVFNAVDQGQKVSEWLSAVFKREGLKLVYMGKNCVRKLPPKYATQAGEVVSFADGFPLLLTSQGTSINLK